MILSFIHPDVPRPNTFFHVSFMLEVYNIFSIDISHSFGANRASSSATRLIYGVIQAILIDHMGMTHLFVLYSPVIWSSINGKYMGGCEALAELAMTKYGKKRDCF